MQTEQLKPTLIQHAPKTLIEEVLEETQLRQSSGLLDLEGAAEQAQARVTALTILRNAAIGATKPIHWLLFKNQQGMVFGRFNFAGAQRIGMVFGITVTPKGPVRIVENHGKRKTAEIYGSATSVVLRLTFDNIRAYRIEGEDFLGRPADDVVRTYEGGKSKTTVGVGDNDWLQSVQTALISKGVRLLSGLVTVTPEELGEVWGMSSEEVIKSCAMGHGFSTDERKAAGQSAASGGGGGTISEPQAKRMFAIANSRIKALGTDQIDAKTLTKLAIEKIAPGILRSEDIPRAAYEPICDFIEHYDPEEVGTAS